MKEKDREQVFVERIVSALDKSTQDLDPGTLSRLRSIRLRAQDADRGRVWIRWGSLFRLPAAGLAAAALVLLATIVYFVLPGGVLHSNRVEDVDILTNTDNLEFYEDLDFYKWLAREAQPNEKESLFRNDLSLQYARNGSPQEAVTTSGRQEKPIGRQQQSTSVV